MILPTKTNLLLGTGAVIGAILSIFVTSSVWFAYNHILAYPRIAHEARQGYVNLSEKSAIEAKLKIEEIRRKAAENITQAHAHALKEANEQNQLDRTRLEQENAEYEILLNNAGRRCEFNGSDIEWLRKP